MKITYIPDGSEDCPLIEIDTETREEILKLIEVWKSLATEKEMSVCLNELMDTHGCILDCVVGKKSNGVRQISDQKFICELPPENWDWIIEMTIPLVDNPNGFQLLNESSEISLLLSPGGGW